MAPGVVAVVRRAATRKPYRVYSWWQGAWWLVDHGDNLTVMQESAARRQLFVTAPFRGGVPINPAGRFVLCLPGQTPETAWELLNN